MKVDLNFELKTGEEDAPKRQAVVRVDPSDLNDVELEVVETDSAGTRKKLGWCKLEIGKLMQFFKKE